MSIDPATASSMNRDSLVVATAAGLILQLAMVIAGHYLPPIRDKGFAIGGMLISLLAGLLYVRLTHGGWFDACIGGAIAGGVCAILAIAVSVWLKDVPNQILLIGTAASAVTGLLGGAIDKLIG
jgi:hypothetical protein